MLRSKSTARCHAAIYTTHTLAFPLNFIASFLDTRGEHTATLRHSNSKARINQCLPLRRNHSLLRTVEVVSRRESRAPCRCLRGFGELLDEEGWEGCGDGGDGGVRHVLVDVGFCSFGERRGGLRGRFVVWYGGCVGLRGGSGRGSSLLGHSQFELFNQKS